MAKRSESKREASLRERAAARGYELVKDGDVYYAAIGDTRFGPLADLDEVDEFLPGEG
jgi:hypothetical protein